MFVNRIIELDNGIEYYVVREKEIDKRTFLLLSHVDTKNDLFDEEFVMKELVLRNGSYETKNVEDSEAKEILMELIKVDK